MIFTPHTIERGFYARCYTDRMRAKARRQRIILIASLTAAIGFVGGVTLWTIW